ncbi:twin-arginine translocase TatA/TatE family subunit [Streptomyces silaceus]|uniref:twin-arginine translocase TatA/TatE family subunit n=1 Tax=Streptomyces silaceus TaxID=545123 RepID=UPI0006EB6006|nr:twin-arginine translocase TatA/TatE family subunit [Streptomyces silaceus]
MFGLSEIAVILIVVIVFLGAKRLPELTRSAGKSARILKAEAKAMKKADAAADGQTKEGKVVEGRVVDADTASPDDRTGWPPPRH